MSCSDCCGVEFESTCNILGQSHHIDLLFQILATFQHYQSISYSDEEQHSQKTTAM